MVLWAALLADRHSLLSASADVLARLVDNVDETAFLFSYEWPGHYATVLSGRQSGKPVRYVLEVGSRAPLHAALLEGDPGPPAAGHHRRPAALRRGTRGGQGRAAGRPGGHPRARLCAQRALAEHIPEACGVASVFYADDRPAGSIDITIPRYRMEPDKMDGIGKLVLAAAQDLSRRRQRAAGRADGDPAGIAIRGRCCAPVRLRPAER